MRPALKVTPLKLTLAYAAVGVTWLAITWLVLGSHLARPTHWVCLGSSLLFLVATTGIVYTWSGRCRAVFESAVERTQREAAEAALRASEERYRLLAENSQDVIWILRRDGRLQYVSPSIQRLLGHTPATMLGLSLRDFLTPESCRLVRDQLLAVNDEINATDGVRSRLIEVEQVRADGSTVWTEIHTTEFREASGHCIGLLGVTRDISQRRAAEQALAREVTRCHALLDVSVDGIHVLDLDGRLVDANDIFLRERGFTRQMIPELTVAQWDAELSLAQIQARLRALGPGPVFVETVHRRHDGSLFPVEAQIKRVDIAGRPLVYCSSRDITERKGMEKRLLRAQRLESVGLIASGIAHDLNNVLTPILLCTGVLSTRYDTPADRAVLKPIEAAARRGSSIVHQILTFARGAEGQRISVHPKVVLQELSALIQETFPRSIAHHLEIARDLQAITGDPTQLHQVFLNLAVNARDAMADGGMLTIDARNRQLTEEEVRSIPSARPGRYVCVTVSDTGTGMPTEVLDHLFEPFFTTKPRERGTGLGLSTVHGLVRSHGGFVEVNSRVGQGSEFRVFLPAISPPGAVSAVPAPAAAPTLGNDQLVLVADDEPAILIVLESLLKRHGFVPLTAANGDEALVLLERHREELAMVVTDVMMPKSDGVRLAAEVRKRCPGVAVIAMSGMMSPTLEDDSRQQLRDLGVAYILDKPYGEAELLQAIKAAFAGKDAREGLAESTPVSAETGPAVMAR